MGHSTTGAKVIFTPDSSVDSVQLRTKVTRSIYIFHGGAEPRTTERITTKTTEEDVERNFLLQKMLTNKE